MTLEALFRWSLNKSRRHVGLAGSVACHLFAKPRVRIPIEELLARTAPASEDLACRLFESEQPPDSARLELLDGHGGRATFVFHVLRLGATRSGVGRMVYRSEPTGTAGAACQGDGGDEAAPKPVEVTWVTGTRPPARAGSRASVSDLQMFVRGLPSSVAVLDAAGRYEAASYSWLREYRLGPGQVIGRSFEELPADLPEACRRLVRNALAGRAQQRAIAWRSLAADGSAVWQRWRVRAVTSSHGRIVGATIASESLTAEKEAEKLREETASRLSDYLDTASHWTWEMDARFVVTHVSEKARSTGNPPEWMVGWRRWERLGVSDPDLDPLWRDHVADLRAHRPFTSFVYSFIRPDDGERYWIELNGKPLFDAEGGFMGYRGTSRDVTDRYLAQRERDRQTEQLRLASEIAKIGYWQHDPGKGEAFLSDAVHGLLGYGAGTGRIAPGSPSEFIHPDDLARVRVIAREAFAQRRPFACECRLVRADGTIMHARIRSVVRWSDERPIHVGIVQDVSDLVETGNALEAKRRENELYRAMIEALPDLIYAKTPDGRFVAANRATARAVGVDSVQRLLGLTDADLFPPEVARGFEADERRMLASGQPMLFEQIMPYADRRHGWISTLKAPFRDGEGRLLGFVGHGRDITEQKLAEAEIRRLDTEARRAHDLLIEATAVMADAFAVFDAAGRLVVCNPAFAQPFDRPAAELVGWCLADLLALDAYAQRTDTQGGSFADWCARRLASHARADGRPFVGRIGGEHYYVRERRTGEGWTVLVSTDITQLMQAEEQLRRRNEEMARVSARLASLNASFAAARDLLTETIDNVAQAVAVFDRRGRLAAWNQMFTAMCEASGLVPTPELPVERLVVAGLLPASPEDLVRQRLAEHVREDGAVLELYARRTPSDNLVVTYTDITERRRAEQQQQEFVSTVSHELRTPLTSIKGALGLLISAETGLLPDRVARLAELAHRNADRLVRLVNDILDVEKLSSGQMQFALRPLDLRRLVQHCLEANEAYAAQGRVRLVLRPDAPSAPILGDADRLHQVLTNVVGNAAKFSPPGETVTVGIELDEAVARVTVEDHGPGIPESFRLRVFERFAQADGSDRRAKGGSGLGLYIARRIVEHHQGRIGYDSEPGSGSTFWIELPLRQEETSATAQGELAQTHD